MNIKDKFIKVIVKIFGSDIKSSDNFNEKILGNTNIKSQMARADEAIAASQRSVLERKMLLAKNNKEGFRKKFRNAVDSADFWSRPEVMATVHSMSERSFSGSNDNSDSSHDSCTSTSGLSD